MNKQAGRYGRFGGVYVPEVLRGPIDELSRAFEEASVDPLFFDELNRLSATFVGRPTPLCFAENLTRKLGGAKIYIKMEGLAHTGAHKINNALGQALLARRMGKKRIIAETGAGQHGVASAAACARLSLDCTVYMGEEDIRRQRPNVFWMELYGAGIVPVCSGSRTLKDAVNEAFRDWASHPEETYYLLGSALGPAPYPAMVRRFQEVTGRETKEQLLAEGVRIGAMVACVGGGSNAVGFFSPFLGKDFDGPGGFDGSRSRTGEYPRLIGVEAGGRSLTRGNHASRMSGHGRESVAQGYRSIFLTDEDGQIEPTHSVSAGLDYPGIGPELAWYAEQGRIEFTTASDEEALEALKVFARHEGMIFALESAHAAAAVLKLAPTLPADTAVAVNMSGRGDKDLFITAGLLGGKEWRDFLLREGRHD